MLRWREVAGAAELRARHQAMRDGVAGEGESLRLPESFAPLFWEYDAATLSWRDDRELILRRVLAEGSWPEVRWLWRRVGNEEIRRWIRHRRGRGLTPEQLRFWQLVLALSADEVEGWLAARRREPWEGRWVE